MKTANIFAMLVLLSLSAKICFGQYNWRNGYNHGRHNANVFNGYNYRGNQWNTNVRHNPFTSQTNVNANYRRNHNFGLGYNARNRAVNVGYKWNFGRRRRSIEAETGVVENDFKLERKPLDSLLKLTELVEQFSSKHKDDVPELITLTVDAPVSDFASNVTVAKEIVCLIKKLQKIFPNTLGNFIVKMIKFHGPSFGIYSLGDFYSVDPSPKSNDEYNSLVDAEYCDISVAAHAGDSSKSIDSALLLEFKKFVADLIIVGMQYQQVLEKKSKDMTSVI